MLSPSLSRGLAAVLAASFACASCAAHSATAPATPQTFAAVFAKAAAGDTVMLAPGAYGDLEFSRRFSSPVTITCADPARPPSMRSFHFSGASNIVLSCAKVDFVPDVKTITWTPATEVVNSDHITIRNVKIIGGNALSGVEETATDTDRFGNVMGWPTGYGLKVSGSNNVLIEEIELARFHKGLVIASSQQVTVRKSDLHDMRTTSIVGWDVSDLTIEGNDLHDAHPWRWNQTPVGDHADLLALWSDSRQTRPNERVRILNNQMRQTRGEAILGMWFEGKEVAPFTDFEIRGNTFIVNNLQGILLSNTRDGVIADNRMYRAGEGDAKQSPTVLLRNGVSGISVTGNLLGAPLDDKSGAKNPASGNKVVTGDANIWNPSRQH